MSGGDDHGLSADLLDDFFAECDEHLTQVRTLVTALETARLDGSSVGATVQALYARLHSLKGNCAIVGLGGAEQLAHAAEGLVRGLSRAELVLTPQAVAALARTEKRLAEIVNAFRLHRAAPGVDDLVEEFAAIAPGERLADPRREPGTTPAMPPARSGVAAKPERRVWHATFSPTPELSARGININSVRTRLSDLGVLLAATPVVAGGAVSFHFTIETNQAVIDEAAWRADGVEMRQDETGPVAEDEPLHAAGEFAAGDSHPVLSLTPSHIMRVDLSRLDDLMRITGDLVIHHSRLQRRMNDAPDQGSALQEASLALARSLREMRQALKRVRLVAISEIFSRLPFVVRDLAGESGKQIDLVVEGRETEIDKFLVERLKEPLLHLVRNAISHGIELPVARAAAGKPERATLRLRASAAGEIVRIEVADDGRGISAEKVAAHARSLGHAVPAELDDAALLALICLPGFSTAEQADRVSGRGVGMAVVADTLHELGGHLSLQTTPGVGTKFTLLLPLSLSITSALIVSTVWQTCAVPQSFIEEIVQVPVSELRAINGVELAPYRDGVLPLVRLGRSFGEPNTTQRHATVLVINSERGCAGLMVERVHGQREIVVRPLVDPLVRVPGVTGATELGDGQPVLILDPATLTRGAVRPRVTTPATVRQEISV